MRSASSSNLSTSPFDRTIRMTLYGTGVRRAECAALKINQLVRDRPTLQGPAFHSDSGRRRIIFQVWDWADDRRYTFHLYNRK
jgi:integrase